jgi:ABC-type branched-subunit amino acid transport system substrate-binding protein
MRKTIITLLCALALSWGLCGKETIKIGVVLPLSGNMSQAGEMGQMGALMRLKELTADSHFHYQLIFEDDGFVYSRTAMAVKKLRDFDHADVIVTMWGYGSEIALPYLANNPQILHLNVDRWSDGRGNNDFVCGASLDGYIYKLVALLKTRHYRRVVFIGTAEQGTEFYRKKILTELPKNGIHVMDTTMLSTEAMDLRTWILKTKEENPDVVLECLQMPTVQILLKQMRDLGVTIPVGHTTQGVFEVEPSLLENSWHVYPGMPTKTWQKKFQAVYGKGYIYPSAQYYNTISLLVNACERLDKTHKPTTAQLAKSVREMESFEGAMGTMRFSAPNHYEAPVSYYIFHNGKPVEATLEEVVKTAK